MYDAIQEFSALFANGDQDECFPLTREAITTLLLDRAPGNLCQDHVESRRALRWPFPGTVQIWKQGQNGEEELFFATSLNLSLDGVGLKSEDAFAPGEELIVAIHEPELSFQGEAMVRHCTPCQDGFYLGLEFKFDDD
ncbi:MAG: PilZ domain-containing protein [Phycisphaerae bacterium]